MIIDTVKYSLLKEWPWKMSCTLYQQAGALCNDNLNYYWLRKDSQSWNILVLWPRKYFEKSKTPKLKWNIIKFNNWDIKKYKGKLCVLFFLLIMNIYLQIHTHRQTNTHTHSDPHFKLWSIVVLDKSGQLTNIISTWY